MRKVRERLRLAWAMGLSIRQVARTCGGSHRTVSELLRRASEAGRSWPLPTEWDDAGLEDRRYRQPYPGVVELRPQPDFPAIHQELRRKGVTWQLLWEEHKEQHGDGYQYGQFCEGYRRWRDTVEVSMGQVHRAGEKLFVDYAGQTVPIGEQATGEVRQAQVFVAVLGCSNYTYAEASWTQEREAWIGAHVRCLEFLGGAPALLVPDNLAAAVTRACRYEPELNPTYQELATH